MKEMWIKRTLLNYFSGGSQICSAGAGSFHWASPLVNNSLHNACTYHRRAFGPGVQESHYFRRASRNEFVIFKIWMKPIFKLLNLITYGRFYCRKFGLPKSIQYRGQLANYICGGVTSKNSDLTYYNLQFVRLWFPFRLRTNTSVLVRLYNNN